MRLANNEYHFTSLCFWVNTMEYTVDCLKSHIYPIPDNNGYLCTALCGLISSRSPSAISFDSGCGYYFFSNALYDHNTAHNTGI